MRWQPRQISVRRMMVLVALAALAIAAIEHRARRRHQLAIDAASVAYREARLGRQVAEMALVEYEQGVLPAELKRLDDEIASAKADRDAGEVQLAKMRRDRAKWSDAPSPVALGIAVQHAAFREEQARARKSVLVTYTKAKTLNELRREVAKARAAEQSRKTVRDRLQADGIHLGTILPGK